MTPAHALRFEQAGTIPADPCSGGASVWLCDIRSSPARMEGFEATLSAAERERAARFRLADDRLRFVASRGLARALLGAALDAEAALVPIIADSAGRPTVSTSGSRAAVTFSVSHAGDLALVAISRDCEVGVDVEFKRSGLPFLDLARTAFASGGQEALTALPKAELPEAFYTLWTRREALLKALGQGLTVPADEVEVSAMVDAVPRVMRVPGGYGAASGWMLHDLQLPDGYLGALALRSRGEVQCAVSAFRLSP